MRRLKLTPVAATGLILALSLGMRLLYASTVGLNLDEEWSLRVASAPWSEFWSIIWKDWHPPFGYFCLQAWEWLGFTSNVGQRMLSISASLCTLFVLIQIGLRCGVRTNGVWLSALLIACSSWIAIRDTEIRHYPLFAFFAWASMGALLMALEGRRWGWAAYAMMTVCGLYTHNNAVLMLPVPWVYIVATCKGKARRNALLTLLIAQICVVLCYAPWLWVLRHQVQHRLASNNDYYMTRRSFFFYLYDWLWVIVVGPYLTPPAALQFILLAAIVALMALGATWWPRRFGIFCCTCVLIPMLGGGFLRLLDIQAFTAKYAYFLYPGVYFLIAGGICWLAERSRILGGVVLVALVGANMASFHRVLTDPLAQPSPWPAIIAAVDAQMQPGDMVIFSPSNNLMMYSRYSRYCLPPFIVEPARAEDAARFLHDHFKRIWLFESYASVADPQSRLRHAFDTYWHRVSSRFYPNSFELDEVTVTCYAR